MSESELLVKPFEEHRAHLRAVAYRMLGSSSEADDAVQEAWLRLSRAGADGVANLGGWLTTVVARVCLDMLRSRTSRREASLDAQVAEPVASRADGGSPEQDALLAESVGLALLAVLDTLEPAERVAFILHDTFDVPFDDIATIVGRSAAAARQLASRARRRMHGKAMISDADVDADRHKQVVDAFLAATRGGDLAGLLAVLAPEVVLHADPTAAAIGVAPEIHGAAAVAGFLKRARAARPALLDGLAGAVWLSGDQIKVAFRFAVADGAIVEVELLADPATLAALSVSY